jgi:putative acetyltransferase
MRGGDVAELLIRAERPADYRTVEDLTRRAFWNLNQPGCDEHYLVHEMRTHGDFVAELAFVAELNGAIIGNIMYTKAKLIEASGLEKTILTFGPLSIAPEFQRRGLGKRLLEHSMNAARALGYDAIVIYGNPANYLSSGFVSCVRHKVCIESGIYPTALLVKELREGAIPTGLWRFRESSAYKLDSAAAERFDSGFPPMPKEKRTSQEEFFILCHSRLHLK